MRRLNTLLNRLLGGRRRGPAVIGLVERFDATGIHGWAVSRVPGKSGLALRIGGGDYPVPVQAIERQDVANRHGPQHAMAGFIAPMSDELAIALEVAREEGLPVEVCWGGEVIPSAAGVTLLREVTEGAEGAGTVRSRRPARPKEAPAEDWEQQGEEDEDAALQRSDDPLYLGITPVPGEEVAEDAALVLDGWGRFSIYGRVRQGAVESVVLRCNGQALECNIAQRHASGPAAASGEQRFEIELPGYLWDNVEAGADAQLEVVAGTTADAVRELMLTRAQCAAWVSEISTLRPGPEQQYRALLALEHVRHGALLPHLDYRARRFVLKLVKSMKLEAWMTATREGEAAGSDSHVVDDSARAGDAEVVLVRRAIREVNERLLRGPGSVFRIVRKAAGRLRFAGDVRRQFLSAFVPALCRSGEIEQLRPMLDFRTLYADPDPVHYSDITLAIGGLAADRDFERATQLLWKLAKWESEGWVNTECIRYAVEHVQALESEGEVTMQVAEGVRYAFLGLLDSVKGDWFSRLYDAELVQTMVGMLASGDRHSEWQCRDVIDAAIRHYGLCPAFWSRMQESPAAGASPELLRCRAAWESVRAAFELRDAAVSERIVAAAESLRYFVHKGNVESRAYLRALLARELQEQPGGASVAAQSLMRELRLLDPAETIRIAAHPLLRDSDLDADPEIHRTVLQSIRLVSERKRAPRYAAQCAVYTAWREATAGLAGPDREHAAARLEAFGREAVVLAEQESLWLGVDALGEALALAAAHGHDTAPFAARLLDLVRRVFSMHRSGTLPPAAVCTVLDRCSRKSADPSLRALAGDLRRIAEQRMDDRYAEVIAPAQTPAMPPLPEGWFGDTLVAVYSCRKYLPTRVQAIRETWLRDLAERGIPYVIVVGDGDGRLDGDVLALEVSDLYEDLPRKTLALLEWVYRNSAARYLVKVDDDCFLHAEAYFGTLSYRKHHYYGRVIRRRIGDTDRVWHHPKSRSQHARFSLDKSPEPSVYADGGGGYCLSRAAIGAVLRMRETPAGRMLARASFMEDKLVGDLLSLAKIEPSNEDYESFQRRRTFGEAMPVSMWESTFYPSRITPTKLVHLDTDRHQAAVRARTGTVTLWPKKLWPTYKGVHLDGWSNQLELLSEQQQAAQLLAGARAPVVVTVVRNERLILPHFLAHYRALGVNCFVFVDNCSDDGTREYLFEEPDVVLYSADSLYRDSYYGVSWQQAVVGNLCPGSWALLADADEFLVYPDCERRPLADFVASVEAEDADTVLTYLVDMYPFGALGDADLAKAGPFEVAQWFDRVPMRRWAVGRGQYGDRPGYVSSLRHRLVTDADPSAFTAQKYALIRYQPWMRFSQGVHDVANARVARSSAAFAHFKYHAGFEEKVRIEIARKQHFNSAEEYRNYGAMLAEMRGGFGDPALSLRYEDSGSFARAGLFDGVF